MADTLPRLIARLERLGSGGMRAVILRVATATAADAEAQARVLAGTRMRVRSGLLRRSIGARVEAVSNGAEVRLRAGGHSGNAPKAVKYAGIQEEGGWVKGNPYLAIPVGPARTAAGVARYNSPRDVPGLVLVQSLKGNPLLVLPEDRRNAAGRLVKNGRAGTVYYVLRRRVFIRGKHYLRDARYFAESRMGETLDAELTSALGGA